MPSLRSLLAFTVSALLFTTPTVFADSDEDFQQPTKSPGAGVTLNKMTSKGCFSNPGGMWDMGPYTYQTTGWCQPLCVRQGVQYFALVNGTNCFCGNSPPGNDAKVPDSQCNSPCSGYGQQNCGGKNKWQVYNDGYRNGDDTGTIHITKPPQTWLADATANGFATTTGGKTIFITQSGQASPTSKSGGGGPNKAAIAAGVVVAIVVVAGGIGGLIFFLRHKKQKELADERRRHQSISAFMNKVEKAPSDYSSSDARLDSVMFQRRESNGSIMDNQDYSRRILKVTNPSD